MLERHLTLTVTSDAPGGFEEFMQRDYLPVLRAFPGCVRVRLLRSASGEQYRIAGVFESEVAEKAWRASAEHNQLSPRLKAFFSEYALEYFACIDPVSE